ncbi:SDR family NAD(P)-dependent oxidoreductase [Lentzea sp.]|uniref:SDR family NAD(P)-dependent oxidoreductase n=1 Tax=Lentzea sp. TaxID=56099 RepID=UPI002ED51408
MATWLVTGANRGLGAEIARAALREGDDVVVGARRTDSIPADLTASPNVLPVALDVTDRAAITAAVDAAVDRFGGVDVLVNNAGYGLIGALEEVDEADYRALFDVNVFGLVEMTRAVLPVMRAAGSGTVVNIGSRGGYEGQPGVSAYCASKFAVEGITEALAGELAPFGIRAVVVEPGNFRTGFLDPSSMTRPAAPLAGYDGTPAHDRQEASHGANHRQPGDPAKAAELIHRVVTGAEPPVHLPIGRDAHERLAVVVEQRLKDAEVWREQSLATAHDAP